MKYILPLMFALVTGAAVAEKDQMEWGRITSFVPDQTDIALNHQLYRLPPTLVLHLGPTKLYGTEAMQQLVESDDIHFLAVPINQQKYTGEIREIWIFPR